MITVPVREVHELELSSLCNLACVYCPHAGLQRDKANIEWLALRRALLHVEHYCKAGTQTELSLTGIGEAILHPDLGEILAWCRAVIGDRLLVLATNGVAMTDEIVAMLAKFRVQVYVSLHRPEIATPVLGKLTKAGVRLGTNHAFVDSALDWAGQVPWHVSAPTKQCDYLGKGWAVIRQNGSVDACCQDAHDLYPIGSVWDEPGSWQIGVTPLCAKCHLIPPEQFQEDLNVRAA